MILRKSLLSFHILGAWFLVQYHRNGSDYRSKQNIPLKYEKKYEGGS